MAGEADWERLRRHAPAIAMAVAAIFIIAALSLPSNGPENSKIEVISSQLQLPAPAPECENGEVQDCEVNGCPGKKACQSGFFSECSAGKRVCSPGQRIACNIDGCRFGYTVCNQCGTGFGDCIDERAGGARACTGNGCG